ncbi:MAG: hypothetical protein ABI672_12385, partial [Vicinamibacteria bacterium]
LLLNWNDGRCLSDIGTQGIEFDKQGLLDSLPKGNRFVHRKVSYHNIVELARKKPLLESWPFLKRLPFADEEEYRIVFESKTELLRAKTIPIDLSIIRKVMLSPWLPQPVADSLVNVIHGIDGCEEIPVSRSSLLENGRWRAIVNPDESERSGPSR